MMVIQLFMFKLPLSIFFKYHPALIHKVQFLFLNITASYLFDFGCTCLGFFI